MDWINQNKFKNWLIIILVAVNILSVSIIWMQTLKNQDPKLPNRDEGRRPPEPVNLMQKDLNLTDDQVKMYEEIRIKHLDKIKDASDKKQSLKDQIAQEIFRENSNTSFVDSLSNQIGLLEAKLENLRFSHFHEFAMVCTPAQREKLKPVLMVLYGQKPPKGEMIEKKQDNEIKEEKETSEKKRQEVNRQDSGIDIFQKPQDERPRDGRPRDDRPNPPSVEEKLAKLSERLNLSEDQVQKVKVILQKSNERGEQIRKRVNPDRDEIEIEKEKIRKEEDDSIIKILNDNQKKEFAKMILNRKK